MMISSIHAAVTLFLLPIDPISGAATTTSLAGNVDSQVEISQVCSRSITAYLESDSDAHVVSISFRPKMDRTVHRPTMFFSALMKTKDGVPSRYSGVCEIAPHETTVIHVKAAESFGRF